MRKNSKPVWDRVEAHKSKFYELSDRIWDRPEENYQEFFACGEHRRALISEGFTVSEGLADIPTAIMGEAGTGGPLIAILGEYDALPGLSQQAGVAEKSLSFPADPGTAVATISWVPPLFWPSWH